MSKNDHTQTSDTNTAKRKTGTKYLAIVFTLVYIALFLITCHLLPLLGFLFENPRIATTLGFSIVSLTLLIPLSMPVSIYFIWSKYQQGLHEQVGFFCALPVAVFMGTIFIVAGLLNIIESRPAYPVHNERSNNPTERREQRRKEFREKMKNRASESLVLTVVETNHEHIRRR